MTRHCALCGGLLRPIFESGSGLSITSLAVLIPGRTAVSVCDGCAHAETECLFDLQAYYDTAYKIGANTPDEDDLYAINGDRIVTRSEHQARVFLAKMAGRGLRRVLDYGCGKSLTSRHAMTAVPELDVHLFDVSRDYVDFWGEFRPADRCAVFEIPDTWLGSFDAVTSFFSLEHVPDPHHSLADVRELVRDDGLLYAVVPNIHGVNRADMLVADHLHHYSVESMRYALEASGFILLEADAEAHQQATVFVAQAVGGHRPPARPNPAVVAARIVHLESIAAYWRDVEERLAEFEAALTPAGVERVYIFGAGIVGAFLYSRLAGKERIAAFVDSNQHKQRKPCCGLSVLPSQGMRLGAGDALLVGLNPGIGESVLAAYPHLAAAAKTFFC